MPRTGLRALAPAVAAFAISVAALLSVSSVAHATVMVEVPLEQLIADADAIVHATVIRSGVRLELRDGSLEPQTVTTLRVHRWLAGAGGTTVTIRELGGIWEGGALRYDGTPEYRRGDEVVLFLERRAEAPHDLRTLAMAQGRFLVRHGAPGVESVVFRDLEGIAFASWSGREQQVAHPAGRPTMELAAFLAYVQSVRETMAPTDRDASFAAPRRAR